MIGVTPKERKFLLGISKEFIQLFGIDVDFYSMAGAVSLPDTQYQKQTPSKTEVDPVYQEPATDWNFVPQKYTLRAFISKPEIRSESEEGGMAREYEANVTIPLTIIEEKNCPLPKEGDIFSFHGRFYEVISFSLEGYISDKNSWTHIVCNVKHTTRFPAQFKSTIDIKPQLNNPNE